MPVTSIDLDDGLASLLAGDLAALNVDIVAPTTPSPVDFGEDVRAAVQALITRAQSTPLVIDSSTALQSLTNDTTPTDILGLSIPGGTLVAGDILEVRMHGRYTNDSGSSRTIAHTLALGGTTLWAATGSFVDDNVLWTTLDWHFRIYVVSSTTVRMAGNIRNAATNAATTGIGAFGVTLRQDIAIGSQSGASGTTTTVPDLASTRTLSLTVTHSAAASTIILERFGYTAVRLRG